MMIDANISEHYGIMPYGKYGCEIVRGNKQVAVFKAHKDFEANWITAVEWAKQQEQPKMDFQQMLKMGE